MGDKRNGALVERLLCEDVAKAALLSSVIDIMEVHLRVLTFVNFELDAARASDEELWFPPNEN